MTANKKTNSIAYLIAGIVIAVAIILGTLALAGVFSKDEPVKDNSIESQLDVEIESFYVGDQTKLKKSDSIVYRFILTDDNSITSMSYSIDNGKEINIEGRKEKLTEGENEGLHQFDTRVQTIALGELVEGTHVLTFYLYQDAVKATAYTHVFTLSAD